MGRINRVSTRKPASVPTPLQQSVAASGPLVDRALAPVATRRFRAPLLTFGWERTELTECVGCNQLLLSHNR